MDNNDYIIIFDAILHEGNETKIQEVVRICQEKYLKDRLEHLNSLGNLKNIRFHKAEDVYYI